MVLILISFIISNVEHLFTRLCVFFEEGLLLVFNCGVFFVCVFFAIELYSSYILDINPLSDYGLQTFFFSIA